RFRENFVENFVEIPAFQALVDKVRDKVSDKGPKFPRFWDKPQPREQGVRSNEQGARITTILGSTLNTHGWERAPIDPSHGPAGFGILRRMGSTVWWVLPGVLVFAGASFFFALAETA